MKRIYRSSVADPDFMIRDPVLFYPLDPGSGMSYIFYFKDFFLKP
jgi:hypothetical protein